MTTIRPEKSEDWNGISEVTRRAFGGEEEVGLINDIRSSEYFIPELSLVAVEDDAIVGNVLFSKIKLKTESGEIPVLSLAPMAVSVRICLATEKVYWNKRFTSVSMLFTCSACW